MNDTYYDIDFDTLDEDVKLKEDWIRKMVDYSISLTSSMSKIEVKKSYDIVNGIRNREDFAYLWNAYGMEFPGTLKHFPTVRAIFERLLGQFMARPFKWQVSCSDDESVKYMTKETIKTIREEIDRFYAELMKYANSAQFAAEKAKQFMQRTKEKYEAGDYQSALEIDAHNVMDWCIPRFKLKQHQELMAEDMIKSGGAFYQVKVKEIGKAPEITILNHEDVYVHKDKNTKFVNDCDRVVVKRKMAISEIWNKYGSLMKQKDRDSFCSKYGTYIINSDIEIVADANATLEGGPNDRDLNQGLRRDEMWVYYVEFKSNVEIETEEDIDLPIEGSEADRINKSKKKKRYRLDLFEGTRIGDGTASIYVGCGRNKYAYRHPDQPEYCYLTINGCFYSDRNGVPYSLPLKIKGISDSIDIMHYHAENLVGMSGTRAITVDMPNIPAFISGTPMERVMKWVGLVKQGANVIDTSQDGAGQHQQGGAAMDMTISPGISVIYDIIEKLEETAYKICGVSRQSTGNITQTDGKGTSELAIQGSEMVTLPLFRTIDNLCESFMTDVVNAARITYGKGWQGSVILPGAGQRVFTVKSKQFPLSALNVWINNEGQIERDLDNIRLMAMELVRAGAIDASVAVDATILKSLTEVSKRVKKAIEDGKADQTAQLGQQVEQLDKQLQDCAAQLDQANKKLQANDQAKLQLEQSKVQGDQDIKNRDLAQKGMIETEKLKNDARRIDLEAAQLQYGNGGSVEVRNN